MTQRYFDVIIIGSGFGGSVSALRLAEKGYRVGVIEAGKRFNDSDFPTTSWRIRKFLFFPRLGLKGIQRIHALPDVLILAGAGVGGGSLVYANTLYRPKEKYFKDSQWAEITDWESELDPWFDQASRMLGVAKNPYFSPSDEAMKIVSEKMGVADTFQLTPLGVLFSESGKEITDPYFGGKGPTRKGCIHCGECMSGCRHNAKNTLPKNYLGLAESAGVQVFPELTAINIEFQDGRWRVDCRKSGAWLGGPKSFYAGEVIIAAGTYNTQKLLHKMKSTGKLPKLSDALGKLSRTNSESLRGAVMPLTDRDFTQGAAITSSFYPDEETHVEPVRYGKGSNLMGLLQTLMSEGASARERRKNWLKKLVREPSQFFRILNVRKWSERSVITLVMQSVDSSITVKSKRGVFGWRLSSENSDVNPNATYIPAANQVAEAIADHYGGVPAGHLGDLVSAPFTAHFVGGCVISDSPERGVIDPYHRVWNYPSLHIVDGSTITANLGVNPSLTITAQAERAISLWPNKGEEDPRPEQGASYQRLRPIAPKNPVVPVGAPGELRTIS